MRGKIQTNVLLFWSLKLISPLVWYLNLIQLLFKLGQYNKYNKYPLYNNQPNIKYPLYKHDNSQGSHCKQIF